MSAKRAKEQYEEKLSKASTDLSALQLKHTTDLAEATAAAKKAAEDAAAEPKARLAADQADHDSRLALAQRYAGDKRYREALDELLEIVRRDKTWRDGEARRQIVNILNLAADQSLASEYRRKLASAIY